jgi:hypothetical protein
MAVAEEVEEKLALKLEALDEAVGYENELEIDGVMEVEGIEGIKVINLSRKTAHFVPIDVIAKEPIRDIVKALLSGDGERVLQGISRCVGYFSRISNWNKSLLSALKDRSKGNYWQDGRTDKEAVGRYVNSKY